MIKEICSKRIDIRVTPKMHKALRVRAEKEERTLSSYIKLICSKAVKK